MNHMQRLQLNYLNYVAKYKKFLVFEFDFKRDAFYWCVPMSNGLQNGMS